MKDVFATLPEIGPVAGTALGFGLGLLLGLAHFASLRAVARLYAGGGGFGRAVALQLARLALLGAAMAGLALLGALPLLAGALGILVARAVILRRGREGS